MPQDEDVKTGVEPDNVEPQEAENSELDEDVVENKVQEPVVNETPKTESEELKELRRELKAKNKEIEKLEVKSMSVDNQPSAEMQAVLENLRNKVEQLEMDGQRATTQVVYADGKKPKYRTPTADDIAEESVTFTARFVFYVVSSYKDDNGIECFFNLHHLAGLNLYI